MQLTPEELESMGREAFHGMEREVSKLWVDFAPDGTAYVRVCLWRGFTPKRLRGLKRLREYLNILTGVEYVGVAYPRDMPWEQIHAIDKRMRLRQ